MSRNKVFVFLLLAAISLSACTLGGGETPTSESDVILTAAALTVEAQLTQAAQQPSLTPTVSPTPTATSTSTPATSPTPSLTSTSSVFNPPPAGSTCDLAGFVADKTIPDGTQITPGAVFTKTWTLRNDGTCTWNTDYDVVFVSGDRMNGPEAQALTGTVAPGATVDVSVVLTAPTTAGTYRGYWKLRNAAGQVFDYTFYVEIKVGTGPTATVGPTITPGGPTLTPTVGPPPIYNYASSITFTQTDEVDLDTGEVSPSGGTYDFEFVVNDPANKFLVPQGGATFLLWGLGAPTYFQCAAAATNSNPIRVDSNLVNQYVCYKTSDGRVGFFLVKGLAPADINSVQSVNISFTTWSTP